MLISLVAIGCSTAVGPSDQWVCAGGGLAADAYQERAQRVARELIAHCQGREIALRVLHSDTLGACAWPDGHIFVTQGLADRLSDDELAAAIAHELGHLVNDGEVHAVCSLSGQGGTLDIEARADATGTDLLEACGIPPRSMINMLEKVRAGGSLPDATQLALAHRVALLEGKLNRAGAKG
jgi:predicted Zn-dependent protease